jgi:hypothetical protein
VILQECVRVYITDPKEAMAFAAWVLDENEQFRPVIFLKGSVFSPSRVDAYCPAEEKYRLLAFKQARDLQFVHPPEIYQEFAPKNYEVR